MKSVENKNNCVIASSYTHWNYPLKIIDNY